MSWWIWPKSSTRRWFHNSWALVTRTTRASKVVLSQSINGQGCAYWAVIWPPLTISTIGQCSRASYSGLDQRRMGASTPAHSHMALMRGAPRRRSRAEVICENPWVEHRNAVCPWDMPLSTGLSWQLKFAEPAKDLDGKLFRNTMGQAKMPEKALVTHSSTLAWKSRGRRSLVSCCPWGR